MSDQHDQPIAGHEYDGIRELDNDLPQWWLFIFWGTIIFAFIYWVHYEVGGGPSSNQELAQSLERIKALRGTGPSFNEDQLAAAFTDEARKAGAAVYAGKCAVCHGPTGGGLIGPNLTDNHWLNGKGTRTDVFEVIAKGVVTKGMPAWAEQLSEGDLVATASFIYSLKGTQVSGGKPPQGQEYP